MKIQAIALVALIAVAAPASAAQIVVNQIATPNLPGYRTYTLSMLTEGSEIFRGVDATFTGAMNQVNPAGQPTIFGNLNGFFPTFGFDPKQDSQFFFDSSSLLQIGAAESDSLLKAAISGLADNGLSNPAPFAQIVTQDGAGVSANLAFDLGGPQPVTFTGDLCFCYLTSILDADVSIESAPAEGLPGHRTYTFWLDYVTNYNNIRLAGEISGDLFQATGRPSPFQSDAPPAQLDTDSHFLFDRNTIAVFDAAKEADNASLLRGDFYFPATSQAASRVAIAQITTDNPSSVDYDFSLEVALNLAPLRLTGTLIPEPTSSLLLAIGGLAAAVRVRC
jgi:hypothetical protein